MSELGENPKGAAAQKRSQDHWLPDHNPTCPKCGDLCGKLARICSRCRTPLYPSADNRRHEAERWARENGGEG